MRTFRLGAALICLAVAPAGSATAQVAAGGFDSVVLVREACRGKCLGPGYRLSVSGGGRVEFELSGERTKDSLSPAGIARLREAVRDTSLQGLPEVIEKSQEYCAVSLEHGSPVTVELYLAGVSPRTIRDYSGCFDRTETTPSGVRFFRGDGLDGLRTLEGLIDSVTRSARWLPHRATAPDSAHAIVGVSCKVAGVIATGVLTLEVRGAAPAGTEVRDTVPRDIALTCEHGAIYLRRHDGGRYYMEFSQPLEASTNTVLGAFDRELRIAFSNVENFPGSAVLVSSDLQRLTPGNGRPRDPVTLLVDDTFSYTMGFGHWTYVSPAYAADIPLPAVPPPPIH